MYDAFVEHKQNNSVHRCANRVQLEDKHWQQAVVCTYLSKLKAGLASMYEQTSP
jgi:hypothetical protein